MVGNPLPQGWIWTKLDQVKHPEGRPIVSGPFGSNIGMRFFVNAGVPVIRGNNLSTDSEKFIDNGFVFLTEEKAKEFKNCEAYRGDLIFTAAGTIGQVGIIPETAKYPRYIISNKQLRARLNEDLILPLFAYYWFSSPEMVTYIIKQNTGSTVPLINLSILRQLPLPLPPIHEQKRIIEFINNIDDKNELNRRMNRTLEELAAAIFKSWFVDFDPVVAKSEGRQPVGMSTEMASFFPNQFIVKNERLIPSGWKIGKLSDIANVIDCLHSKKPERQTEGKLFLQLNNIRDDALLGLSEKFYISRPDYQLWISRFEAREGDCVITNVGRVGAVAQIPPKITAAIGRNMTGIRCKEEFKFPTFLIQALISDVMKDEITQKTDSGTILDALNVKNIPELEIIIPPTEIVAAFERIVRPLRAKMENNLAENLSLSCLRDMILPKLLSGEIRLN